MRTAVVEETSQENVNAAVPKLDFGELFRQYYPRIYNYLRYRVNSLEDAEDLISMVFEKAYTRREQFDATKGTFSTWLFQIAHHTLTDFYRARQRRSVWEATSELPDDLVMPEASPEAQVIQNDTIARLLQGLERLSQRDREVISLRFAGRLSYQEIGQIMNLKAKTVSVVLLRAVRRLQRVLQETTS